MKSKRLLLMLLMALIAPWATIAQTVTVCDGTENNEYVPFYGYWADAAQHNQMIFPADGLTAMTGKYVTQMVFYIDQSANNGTNTAADRLGTWTVSLGETTATTLDGLDNTTALSQVYQGYFDCSTGFLTLDFDDPYTYNGGNLLVDLNHAAASYNRWYFLGVTATGASYTYGAQRNFLPKTTFAYQNQSSCNKPTDVVASYTGGDTAVVTWNGDADSYNIDVNGTIINGVSSPYTLTDLAGLTTYTVKVQSDCGGGDVSLWALANSFTTDAAIPLFEAFSTTSTPYGWSMYTGMLNADGTATLSSSSSWSFGTGNGLTDIHAKANVYANNQRWLVLPSLTMQNNVELTFDLALTVWSSSSSASPTVGGQPDDKFIVLISANDGETWEVLRQWDNAGSEYVYDAIPNTFQLQSIDLSRFAGSSVTIAFYGESTESNGDNNIHVDNVSIDYIPACPKPTGLTVANVTNHTADLSWNQLGEASEWEVVYTLEGREFTATTNTNPYTLTGLDADSPYTVKVRANCGADGYSEWSNEVSFTTMVACPAPTNLTVSDIQPIGATVTWEGIADNYNLRYGTIEGFFYDFESAEPWAVDDFAPCSTYDGDGLHTYQLSDWTPIATNQYYGAMQTFQSGIVEFDNGVDSAHGGNLFGGFVDGIPTEDVANNNDFFITPSIAIQNGDVFEFWATSLLSNWGLERMKVGVYGGEGTISQYFAGSDTEYVEVPIGWTKYSYDLSAFAGQSIQLAINCVSSDAYVLGIDDIFVGSPNVNWNPTITNATSPYTLDLEPEKHYVVEVQAVCGGEDGSSEWVSASFATPSNCSVPFALNATDIMLNSATLNWDGYQESFNLQYRTAASIEKYYFNDFNDQSITGWTYDGYWIYGIADPIYNVVSSDNYFLTMGWATEEEVTETIVSCELPAYESGANVEFYYFGYNEANTFQVGYSFTTNEEGAFTWSDPIDAPLSTYTLYREALADGVKYVAFKATVSSGDACIFIDDFGIFGNEVPVGAWVPVNNVTSPYTLNGLASDTEYEWQVQGINTSCDGGLTEWSSVATFETPSACTAPTNLEVDSVSYNSATFSWDGVQESFNLRYRTSIDADIFFTENFSNGIGNWTMVDCEEETGINGGSFAFYYTYEPPQYLISPELDPVGPGTFIQFVYAAYSANYPESFMVGYSSTGNSVEDFTWGDTITTSNTNGSYYQEAVPEGTKYFAIQCTSYDAFYLIVDNFMLYDNVVEAGEWVEVTGVTSPYTLTGLDSETWYDWQLQADGCDTWYDGESFETLEQTIALQNIALQGGANWVSFNVEITLDNLKAALLGATGGQQALTIQSQTQNASYNPNNHRWTGRLSTLDLSKMYKISVVDACEISLEGMPIDPTQLEITIENGANWIAFPMSVNMTPANAFAGFALPGDKLQSQSNNAQFNGTRWTGRLTNMEPGKGYIYTSEQLNERPLYYPAATRKAAENGVKMSVVKKSFEMPELRTNDEQKKMESAKNGRSFSIANNLSKSVK